MVQTGFNDPLRDFNWACLYARYDEMCAAFNPHSPLLGMFEPALPSSDRALYYKLAGAFETIRSDRPEETAALYGAMLYWKLYSQHRVRGKIIGWTEEAREPLARLLQTMPVDVEPHQEDIAELERRVLSFGIPGMKSPTAIPVRATLLHFLYPNVAPLFDRMVLRAVGVISETASHDRRVYTEYISYARELAARYRHDCAKFSQETPLRVVDMALWATRGRPSRLLPSPALAHPW